jgi:hypothetical protein
MLLYELTSPVEHKYGGSLTPEEEARCSRQTELHSPRWTPYPKRPSRVENICGKFVVRVEESTATEGGSGTTGSGETSSAFTDGGSEHGPEHGPEPVPEHEGLTKQYISCLSGKRLDPRLDSVCFRNDSPFGKQFELFHIAGHVTVRSTPGLPRSVIFKGVKGVAGTDELARDLFMHESVFPLVHMGVISSCLGLRLQTSQCCYLENKVSSSVGSMRGGWMRVEPRSIDQCNIVRLSVRKWPDSLPEHLIPLSNDIVITGKGSVMHRFAWSGVPWTEANEQAVLDVCAWVAGEISLEC